MTEQRAALYLDFDNVFGGLYQLDPAAAMRFGERPGEWLTQLRESRLTTTVRRWLILKCYLNPSGSVPQPGAANGKERLYLSRFRPYLVRAGFEVVDCPPLTARQKNAADLRMALDINDALTGPYGYDEFVIGSGDSDFTPLLVRLRAADRRSTVISTSNAAEAYVALADRLIDAEEFLALLGVDLAEIDEPEAAVEKVPSGAASESPDPLNSQRAFREFVTSRYESTSRPLNLANLGQEVTNTLGAGPRESGWFGTGAFSRALEALGLPGLRISTQYVWDERRHRSPDEAIVSDAPEPIVRLVTVTSMPNLSAEQWEMVFAVLAEYAQSREFSLSDSTRWSRDRAVERGVEVGRSAFGYVVRGVAQGGCPLYRKPPPASEELATAFVKNALTGGVASRLTFTESEIDEIFAWFGATRSMGQTL